MNRIWPLVVLICLTAANPLTAQTPPQPVPADSSPEQEARILEKELVRMVKSLMAKSRPKRSSYKLREKEGTRKASLPEPAAHDARTFRNQLAKWKDKSLQMAELLRQQKVLELKTKHDQQRKKTLEKLMKRERVAINPKRRPGGEKEAGRFEKLADKELGRLDKEQEAELRKVERESRQEKNLLKRMASDLEKAMLPDSRAQHRERKAYTPKRHSGKKK
jgi:hypothetical protein